MKQEWPGVIRSKGFFWLATRMPYVGVWSKAGKQTKLEMAGKWFATVPRKNWPDDPEEIKSVLLNWQEPHGDRRQEIVLIGYADKMDESFLKECFDACLLNDEEMNLGEISWSDLKDPLPQFE